MMSLALVWLAGASGFVLPAQPALPRPGAAAAAAATAAAAAASAPTVLRPHAAPPRAAPGAVQMGLFGLGYPELAVIGLVGIVLLGPERLVPMARDLGSAPQPSLTRARALARPVRRWPCRRGARVGSPGARAVVALTPALAPAAGKSASGLKEVSDSFAQGMAEGEVRNQG